jgi:saccharopine dehydrogenase-like NADP-dependent oxidoreductase
MQTVLIAGAGKTSNYLIHFFLTHAHRNKLKVIVADSDANAIAEKIGDSPFAEAAVIDITKPSARENLVKRADIVISLMPPDLHILLAKECLKHKKNLITSSYISEEMKEMDEAVKKAGLMFMCEMGLDPGIDHMTANKLIHGIQRVSGIITGFKSYCGGLIAPESDTNPWHYKFTWNPRNVIIAGMGGAKYLYQGKQVEVPYEKMFEHNKKIKVDDVGMLAWYPNRDSMRYMNLYDVPDIQTFIRATLRHPAFCKGWQAFVLFGLTAIDDHFDTRGHTYTSWLMKKSGYPGTGNFQEYIASKLGIAEDDKTINLLKWLGFFDDIPFMPSHSSSAELLLELLQDKWKLETVDKDMVIMQHEIDYIHKGRKIKVISSMVIKGENKDHSAMAKTVGLPMGILAKMVLNKKITPPTGVLIPNMVSVYRPVLTELAHYGISFKEVVE